MENSWHISNDSLTTTDSITENKKNAEIAYTLIQHGQTRRVKRPDYTPLTARLWFIGGLIVITIALGVSIEVLLRRLPSELDLSYPTVTTTPSASGILPRSKSIQVSDSNNQESITLLRDWLKARQLTTDISATTSPTSNELGIGVTSTQIDTSFFDNRQSPTVTSPSPNTNPTDSNSDSESFPDAGRTTTQIDISFFDNQQSPTETTPDPGPGPTGPNSEPQPEPEPEPMRTTTQIQTSFFDDRQSRTETVPSPTLDPTTTDGDSGIWDIIMTTQAETSFFDNRQTPTGVQEPETIVDEETDTPSTLPYITASSFFDNMQTAPINLAPTASESGIGMSITKVNFSPTVAGTQIPPNNFGATQSTLKIAPNLKTSLDGGSRPTDSRDISGVELFPDPSTFLDNRIRPTETSSGGIIFIINSEGQTVARVASPTNSNALAPNPTEFDSNKITVSPNQVTEDGNRLTTVFEETNVAQTLTHVYDEQTSFYESTITYSDGRVSVATLATIIPKSSRLETITAKTTIAKTTSTLGAQPTEVRSPFDRNYTEADLPTYRPGNFSPVHYFVGTYLGALAAIVFGIFWMFVSVELQYLEPFYQISRPGGAFLGSTFCRTYVTDLAFTIPFTSVWYHHWAVAWASIASLFATIVLPTFASSLFKIKLPDLCWDEFLARNYDNTRYCYPTLVIQPWPARAAQISLAIIVLFGGLLFYVQWRRGNFLYAPITSIAGVAILAQNPAFLAEFQSRGPEELESMGCQLTFVHDTDGEIVYTMVPSSPQYPMSREYLPNMSNRFSNWRFRFWRRDQAVDHENETSRLTVRIWLMCLFWIYLATMFAFIVVYRFSTSFLDPFLNSDTTVVRIVVTLVAAVAQVFWGMISKDIQAITPYHNLSSRGALAKRSILLSYVHTVPFWTSLLSLSRADFLVFITATGNLFAEVLTIVIPAIPFSRSQSFKDSIYVGYVGIALSGLMLLILTLVIFLARKIRFTVQPNTVAGLISYLCQSNMVANFEGLSMASERERRKILMKVKKKYGLGYSNGLDGIERLVIDEEVYLTRRLD